MSAESKGRSRLLLFFTGNAFEIKGSIVNNNKSRLRSLEKREQIAYTLSVGLKDPIIFCG